MPAIFISYRREDSAGYAGRIHEELEGRLGHEQVFRDADTLRAGQDFEDAIRQRLEHCQTCLVLIGPNWVRSQTETGARRLDQPGDYVCMEIAAALARAEVLVIPVLVGGAKMPASAELPLVIRPLARRHAMSVRDETWEADMDRLAAALKEAGHASAMPGVTRTPAGRPTQSRAILIAAAGAVLLVVGAGILWLGRDAASAPPGSGSGPPPMNTSPDGASYAIDVPSTGSEISLGDLVYVVLSGSVQRRGESQRVWLRIRASNEGFYGANFWDDLFRLVIDGQSIAPNGGLNEVLEQRSIRQAVIRFDVPSLSSAAVLRMTYQGKSGEVPLDLSSNGGPPKHDEADSRDGLSHAVFSSIVAQEMPLLTAGDLSTTMLRIGRRAFVNTQRITVVVRWTNTAPYAAGTWDLVLRLASGGEVVAPVRAPAEAVAPQSTYVGDVVFELPPDVRTAVLMATLRGAHSEQTLNLH
jgi:hypothetical protein